MFDCVKKRNGELEEVSYDKVTRRIKYLSMGLLYDGTRIGNELNVNYCQVAQKVISFITNGIDTRSLDDYAAKFCASMMTENYEYGILGGRIAVSNHQKNTLGSFGDTMKLLYENKGKDGRPAPLISREFYKNVTVNKASLDAMVDYSRDYRFTYFGFSTLYDSYLFKGEMIMERPQHLYMRLAVTLGGTNLQEIRETYDLLSLGYYTHASPTMFNAGSPYQQLSSCFLLGIGDSMDADGGIPDCWKACAKISKRAGGIGIGLTPLRAEGSNIIGTGGKSSGIMPVIKIFNNIAKYVNQGGRRPGAFAIYLEPWHSDIMKVVDAKKATGLDDERARDLFYGLMIPDIFMKRVVEAQKREEGSPPVMWSLMCPNECPGLYTSYGEKFEKLYLRYEQEHKYKRQIDIMELWKAIMASQKETGVPYMIYKDNVNRCNNQSNLGTIRNSNLCCEIMQYSDDTEYAVCNLASISLAQFVVSSPGEGDPKYYFKGKRPDSYFDLQKLIQVASVAHRNLDRLIDINVYPVIQAKKSNLRHRPVGLGVQGLADALIMLGYSFESQGARELNKLIFEAIYYGSMRTSVQLARDRCDRMVLLKEDYEDIFHYDDEFGLRAHVHEDLESCGRDADRVAFALCDLEELKPLKEEILRDSHHGAYATYIGSPLSEGKFQFDLWGTAPSAELGLDWEGLRQDLHKYGARNSLTTCVMPTASTAQILGNTECIEPFKYNLYTRRVKSGEFKILNEHLQRDLMVRRAWTQRTRDDLIKHRGSIQNMDIRTEDGEVCPDLPYLKELYKTAYEVSKKRTLELAGDRSPFIDQAQSLNMFVVKPTNAVLHSIFVTGWKLGLKTGMYYLRREPVANAVQFTVCESCEG